MAVLLPKDRSTWSTTFVWGEDEKLHCLTELPIPQDAYVLWTWSFETKSCETYRKDEIEWPSGHEDEFPCRLAKRHGNIFGFRGEFYSKTSVNICSSFRK